MSRLRIIGGEWKGRRIRVPEDGGVRPTPERAREALFSILGAEITAARVLDAYSGSGALGFEALSRGAASVVFIDSSRTVVRCLRRTVADLGAAERCRVVAGEVVETLAGHTAGPFDVILADPPYGSGEASRFLPRVGEPEHLASAGLVIVERATESPVLKAPGGSLALVRSSAYGRTRLDFYRRPGES